MHPPSWWNWGYQIVYLLCAFACYLSLENYFSQTRQNNSCQWNVSLTQTDKKSNRSHLYRLLNSIVYIHASFSTINSLLLQNFIQLLLLLLYYFVTSSPSFSSTILVLSPSPSALFTPSICGNPGNPMGIHNKVQSVSSILLVALNNHKLR